MRKDEHPALLLTRIPRTWLISPGLQKSGFSGDVNFMDK